MFAGAFSMSSAPKPALKSPDTPRRGRPALIKPGPIADFLARHDGDREAAAAALGISLFYFNSLLNGRRAITKSVSYRISAVTGEMPPAVPH